MMYNLLESPKSTFLLYIVLKIYVAHTYVVTRDIHISTEMLLSMGNMQNKCKRVYVSNFDMRIQEAHSEINRCWSYKLMHD